MTANPRRRPTAKRASKPPTKPAAKPAQDSPGEKETIVSADMASRARGIVVAEIPLDHTRAIRITELPGESPAEPPLVARTEQAHNDLLATAGIRASDVEAAGRLRRNGCDRAAREMMLCSLRQQADRLGIPTDLPL